MWLHMQSFAFIITAVLQKGLGRIFVMVLLYHSSDSGCSFAICLGRSCAFQLCNYMVACAEESEVVCGGFPQGAANSQEDFLLKGSLQKLD
jgi:hypothetical protein